MNDGGNQIRIYNKTSLRRKGRFTVNIILGVFPTKGNNLRKDGQAWPEQSKPDFHMV